MAGAFDITTTSTSVKLPPSRTGQLVFTVTNTSGRPLTVRGVIVTPQSPDQKAWFNIEGAVERPAPPNVGLQYAVNIAVPMSAPAGPAVARLDAIAREDPDAYQTQGPAVVVDVPPAVVPPVRTPFPWWIVAVAVAVLLVLGGGGYLVYRLVNNTDPAAAFAGHWIVSSSAKGGITIDDITIARSGTSDTFEINGTASCLTPTNTLVPCNFSVPANYDPTHKTLVFNLNLPTGIVTGSASVDQSGNTMVVNLTGPGFVIGPYVFTKQ